MRNLVHFLGTIETIINGQRMMVIWKSECSWFVVLYRFGVFRWIWEDVGFLIEEFFEGKLMTFCMGTVVNFSIKVIDIFNPLLVSPGQMSRVLQFWAPNNHSRCFKNAVLATWRGFKWNFRPYFGIRNLPQKSWSFFTYVALKSAFLNSNSLEKMHRKSQFLKNSFLRSFCIKPNEKSLPKAINQMKKRILN